MELFDVLWLGKPLWMWFAFLGLVAALLSLDLGVFHRDQREIGVRESFALSAFYIALGLAFGGWIWWQLGADAGLAYITGFVIEKSLAVDNIFVIAMIFTYFAVPRIYQHRVLFWGVVGVIVLRAIMIGLGSVLVSQFSWVLYVFAGVLIITGIKMWLSADKVYDVGSAPALKWIRRHFNVSDIFHGDRFWVRQPDAQAGVMKWFMTPLFLALIMVELVDVIFAVDSVPAIFAITTDPFLVYTSNIFAILGLRALYFALAAIMDRFQYLKYALSILLVLVGAKIVIADALGLAKIPPAISLSVTFAVLATGMAWSLWKTRRRDPPMPE
ncbi:MAG: TerC family protein [Rhodospirillaceae bacterium]|nr:TerC family protein [Rhodospirillaceae bacterium]